MKSEAINPATEAKQAQADYRWEPEGNGLSLYRWENGQRIGPSRGRLNTDATMSTVRLGQLYNSASALIAACEAAIKLLDGPRVGQDQADIVQQLRSALALAEKGTV